MEKLKLSPYTLIIYESPHRILKTLKNIKDIFGNRTISISREISKLHEEIYYGKIEDVEKEIESNLKGEFVIVIEGNNEVIDYSNLSIKEHVEIYLDELDEKEAIKKVAKERNIAKSVIYKEYHSEKHIYKN